MVWGTIWLGGRSKLVIMKKAPGRGFIAETYINTLEEGLILDYNTTKIF